MTLCAAGDADAAVEVFDAALALHPGLLLWQRGLALFFAGRYEEAAAQFEADLAVNPNDVEEVVFHALCMAHASGGTFPPLLSCGADPRGATMEAVKQLYAGIGSPQAVLDAAASVMSDGPAVRLKVGEYSDTAVGATLSTGAKIDAMCSARYYLGAWHEAKGEHAEAMHNLSAAAAAPSADYMGRIAVMHYERARKADAACAVPHAAVGGYACPRVIVGGWQLSSGHSTHPEGDDMAALRARCVRDLTAHAAAGLTAFDFGDIYSGVEVIVGRFVRNHVAAGGCRSSLQLHTKLVPDLDRLGSYSAADVRAVVRRSASRLHSSYVDLVQFHWWDLSVQRYVEVAQALSQLKREGLVREIGLTNFALSPTREICDAGVPVAATQVQLSLLDRRAETSGLSAYCEQRGISILPYGVLAGGLLSDRYLGAPPPSFDPADHETRSLTKYLLIVQEAGGTWSASPCATWSASPCATWPASPLRAQRSRCSP